MSGAIKEKPVVFVVDDESVCKALKRLMKSVRLKILNPAIGFLVKLSMSLGENRVL